MAIARDIKREDPDEVVQKWKHHMLCTNCRFVLLEDQWKRYWHALAVREDIDHLFRAVVRTCYQRVVEVLRFMDRMRERMPEAQVTAARVEAEYKENVKT